jgi:hypothetical protein
MVNQIPPVTPFVMYFPEFERVVVCEERTKTKRSFSSETPNHFVVSTV